MTAFRKTILLLTVAVLGLLALSTTLAADKSATETTAYFVVPDGESEIRPDAVAIVCVGVTNTSDTTILLNTIRMKGVEQTKENPIPLRNTSMIPSYIDSVKVTYVEWATKARFETTAEFPLALSLAPKQFAVGLLHVKTPKAAGDYSVDIQFESSERVGQFAKPPDLEREKASITAEALNGVHIEWVVIGRPVGR